MTLLAFVLFSITVCHCFLHSDRFGLFPRGSVCLLHELRDQEGSREPERIEKDRQCAGVFLCFPKRERERGVIQDRESAGGEVWTGNKENDVSWYYCCGVAALVFGFKKLPEVGWRAKRVSSLNGTVNLRLKKTEEVLLGLGFQWLKKTEEALLGLGFQ
ncbi:uncharacterized protein LOC133708172 [Rosa rugosa]|uniref:uncharacterized protein LOC133708172 n=1 Tax=Rosa rugosa TaxID=74645 RepID=UPI002B408662|nr:uncharacterized protein LOC133708172 [Rosa rugosa]XP_061989614.1 uncharacterized protein LOC133708172 [Rosa rugosa]